MRCLKEIVNIMSSQDSDQVDKTVGEDNTWDFDVQIQEIRWPIAQVAKIAQTLRLCMFR